MKRFVSSSSRLLPVLFAALFVMVPVTSTMASTVLSSNIEATPTTDVQIQNGQWAAAPFRTTSALTTLTGVNLSIFDNGDYVGGNMSIEIWTSRGTNAGPDTLFNTLYQNPFTSSPVSISGVSVGLNPNTEYFVVARGVDFTEVPSFDSFDPPRAGSLKWDGVGGVYDTTGDGYVEGMFVSSNDGSSWTDFSFVGAPMMTVFASSSSPSSVPEIDPASFGSVAALLTGAFGLIEQRRRRRGTATALTV